MPADDDFEEVEDNDEVVIVRGPASIIDKFFGTGDGIEESSSEGEEEGEGDGDDDSEEARFKRFREWEASQGGGEKKPTPITRRKRKRADEQRTGTEGGRGRRGYFD
jgi:hypothetical protein